MYHWLKEQNYDLCLLQETHCESEDDILTWSKEWEGKVVWSNGTRASKGVAILVKPKLDIKFTTTEKDLDGRYLNVCIEIDDLKLSLVNIYAPNKIQERKLFFNSLTKKLKILRQVKNDHEVIIAGDFNCALNPQNDRRNDKGQNVTTPDGGINELQSLIIENNLEDIWRRRNPYQKRYTFFKKNQKLHQE